ISLMLYASLIALFKLGATAVFLDPQTRYRQLNQAVALADASAFIGTQKLMWLRFFSSALRHIPHIFLLEGGGAFSLQQMRRGFSPRTEIADVPDDHLALITFTGGGTDLSPRGVLRTHSLLIEQHRTLSRILPVRPDDVDLPAFPVATLHNLASGITSVIPDFPFRRPAAVQPEKILRQIESFGITTASGPPAYWSAIVKYCLHYKKVLPLRRIVAGGATTSPKLMRQLKCIAPNAEILNLYGSTEAEPVAKLCVEELSEEIVQRIETGAGIPLGRPVAEVCVGILDGNYNDRSTNEVGEIWVSGEHVARGYFSNPQANATNKHLDLDGVLWHRMGDIGYKDNDRWLWLVGRVNTIVIRDGKPMYPVQVEAVVERLPFIRRAALIGEVDKRLGERAILIVEFAKDVPFPTGWRREIQAVLDERGWVLDAICFIRKMPMDARHNSRVDYQKMKSTYSLSLWERVRGRTLR
ncbi:MAG TPA: AMP-binding protein, partial [Anaerolineales bacterium]|nr:AMP-binding protein [Anaerolineales bacterium]